MSLNSYYLVNFTLTWCVAYILNDFGFRYKSVKILNFRFKYVRCHILVSDTSIKNNSQILQWPLNLTCQICNYQKENLINNNKLFEEEYRSPPWYLRNSCCVLMVVNSLVIALAVLHFSYTFGTNLPFLGSNHKHIKCATESSSLVPLRSKMDLLPSAV